MPNKKRIKLWVDRLRDRESKQTTGRLVSLDIPVTKTAPMCCLGHACQVYKEATNNGLWQRGGFYPNELTGGTSILPQEVMEWFGFSTPDPILKEPTPREGLNRTATWLNDTGNKSLREIADWVEATYLKD